MQPANQQMFKLLRLCDRIHVVAMILYMWSRPVISKVINAVHPVISKVINAVQQFNLRPIQFGQEIKNVYPELTHCIH